MIKTDQEPGKRTSSDIAETILVGTTERILDAEATRFVDDLKKLLAEEGIAQVVTLDFDTHISVSPLSSATHPLKFKTLYVKILDKLTIYALPIAINRRLDGVAARAIDPTVYTPEQFFKRIIVDELTNVESILQKFFMANGGKYVKVGDQVQIMHVSAFNQEQKDVRISEATGLPITHSLLSMLNNRGERFIVDGGKERSVFQALLGWVAISS